MIISKVEIQNKADKNFSKKRRFLNFYFPNLFIYFFRFRIFQTLQFFLHIWTKFRFKKGLCQTPKKREKKSKINK